MKSGGCLFDQLEESLSWPSVWFNFPGVKKLYYAHISQWMGAYKIVHVSLILGTICNITRSSRVSILDVFLPPRASCIDYRLVRFVWIRFGRCRKPTMMVFYIISYGGSCVAPHINESLNLQHLHMIGSSPKAHINVECLHYSIKSWVFVCVHHSSILMLGRFASSWLSLTKNMCLRISYDFMKRNHNCNTIYDAIIHPHIPFNVYSLQLRSRALTHGLIQEHE